MSSLTSDHELPDHLSLRFQRMPKRVRESLPHPEPQKPPEGWKHQVAQPYISPQAKQSVTKAIDEGFISSATQPVRDFQDELKHYFRIPTAKACSSGYSALVLCLKVAGIGAGDEVLVPALTMVAVPNAVLAVGAKPIVVDVCPDTYNPSPDQFRSSVTTSTKAVIVTHTYGLPVDLDGVRRVCDELQLVLVEDIAESIGTSYNDQLTGTQGDFAAASLYANKLITSGDGGFVLSRHSEWRGTILQDRLDSLVNHGFVPKFHFMHFEQSGNYKMAGLAAALITPAVRDIQMLIEGRIQLAAWYRRYLSDVPQIKLMPKSLYGPDAPWVFCVETESRKKRHEIRCAMAQKGIETRDFFLPLHLQPALLSDGDGIDPPSRPNAEHLGDVGFYLPTHFYLKKDEVLFISNALRSAVGAEDYK